MPEFDVMVIGGGIVGAGTAYALAKRGAKVVLIDQFEPGHTHGSSHGDSRIVRFNYPEEIYVQMATQVYPLWEKIGAEAGYPVVQKSGLVECAPQGNEVLAQVNDNLQKYGIPFERLTGEEAMRRFPFFRFDADADVIYQADGAVAFASKAVRALWSLSRNYGVLTVMNKRIAAIDAGDGQVVARSVNGETWRGKSVVITVGGWAQKLLASTGLNLPVVPTLEKLAYFPVRGELNHHVGNMPSIIDYYTEIPFYGLPQVDVAGVKLGWHHTGETIDPDKRHAVRPEILEGLQDWVDRRFPHLSREPLETVDCIYSNTPDYHFVLDRHPQFSNIVIGAGFSGHGFKFGPVLGEILAALALKQTPSVALETFSLARFGDVESLIQRTGA